MKIVIIAATEFELPKITHSHHAINLMVGGIGTSQTAYNLTKAILSVKPDLCIQLGIAGAFSNELKIGDVVNIIEDRYADFGVCDQDGTFIPMHTLSFANRQNVFESEKIINENNYLNKLPFLKATAITVNTASGEDKGIAILQNRYFADIESMEGAAFFAVCHSENIPCIQLRAISNFITARNTNLWNIPLAIENLSRALETSLNIL